MGKLTDAKIRALKSTDKHQKVYDGGGLYLIVYNTGGKAWRIDYRFNNKPKTLSLGLYPVVTLAEARERLLEVKRQLAAGIDPNVEKQAVKAAKRAEIASLFENVVELWFDTKQEDRTDKHKQDILSKLERFIYPTFKGRFINTITTQEMLECIRKIEAKGIYETTRKTLGICNQIFAFAVGEGKVDINICSGLSNQLKPVKSKNYAHITDKTTLAEFLTAVDGYRHNILIKHALQIAPLVFVRPAELINARWEEFDLEGALWTIPAERMKLRRVHVVPLAEQTLSVLHELSKVTSGEEFLFMNWNTGKPLTTEGLNKAIKSLGFGNKTTTHGLRHTASTMLNEMDFNRDHIEMQLAHYSGKGSRGTYNHAEYLQQRRLMMQKWAEYLEKLKKLGA